MALPFGYIAKPLVKDWQDSGASFTRKLYFVLNMQAICDLNKHTLWLSSCHIGSCHDSQAFSC